MLFFLGYVLAAAAFYAICCAKAPMQETEVAKVIYLSLPEEVKKAA